MVMFMSGGRRTQKHRAIGWPIISSEFNMSHGNSEISCKAIGLNLRIDGFKVSSRDLRTDINTENHLYGRHAILICFLRRFTGYLLKQLFSVSNLGCNLHQIAHGHGMWNGISFINMTLCPDGLHLQIRQ